MRHFFSLLPVFFFAGSCIAGQRKENTIGLFKAGELGYTRMGVLESCQKTGQDQCNPPSDEEKKFHDQCIASGFRSFLCSCEKYLCESNLVKPEPDNTKTFTGFDLNGVKRTCQEKDPLIFCSQSFEESDQFALKCRNKGFQVFTCGCHDHLCSEKFEQSD